MQRRWNSFKKIVRLWVELLDRHSLLTYASAIALRALIAAVACSLFALGILGASHQQELWRKTIGPEIEPKVLPHVFDGIDQTVNRVFSSSTAGLLALAAALAVWEVSGIIRAGIGALDEIYETQETRPFWIRSAQLSTYLRREVGDDWWRSADTGEILRGLFAEGTRPSTQDIARRLGFDPLDTGPLVAELNG